MLTYLARRLVLAAITILAITVVTFVILHLPPVDFVTAYAAQAAASGTAISAAEADAMRLAYGLNQPLWVQYWKWLAMVASGNFGRSFEYGRPVTEVIGDRLWLTVLLSLGADRRHLGARLADRHLLRGPAILDRRLRFHLPGLRRTGHPELPAGTDRHVFRTATVRDERRRPVLRRPATGALDLGRRSSTCCNICRCRC